MVSDCMETSTTSTFHKELMEILVKSHTSWSENIPFLAMRLSLLMVA
jgi:hypothetical protein